VAQRVGKSIALLFHDRGTRRGEWSAARPRRNLPPGKDPVPILQEVGWAPEPVWTGRKSRPHRDSIPDFQPIVSRCTDWAIRQKVQVLRTIFIRIIPLFCQRNACSISTFTTKYFSQIQPIIVGGCYFMPQICYMFR